MSDLIKRTFPLRRQTILEKPMNLDSMFERFPFLQNMGQVYALYELLNFSFINCNYVMTDLEQIHNEENLQTFYRKSWTDIAYYNYW